METRNKSLSRNLHSSKPAYTDREIREKMENPYWVPKRNTDLFQIKEILSKEKKMIKKNMSIAKMNRKNFLDTMHNTKMWSEFSYYKNNYVKTQMNFTDRTNNEDQSTYIKTKLNTEGSVTSPTVILDQITERKDRKLKENESDFKKASDQVEAKHILMKNKRFEGVREFVDKTRELILTKYKMKIKEERILRLEETYKNEVESVKDTITDMEYAKEKFDKEFLVQFDAYMKHLTLKKNKEKNDLSELENMKANLEADLKQLENKKQKQNEKLDLFWDFRYFQICIKEGITLKAENNIVNNLKKKDRNYLTFMTQIQQTLKGSIKKMPTQKSAMNLGFKAFMNKATEEASNYTRRFSKYTSQKIIFNNPNDLVDTLKNMETSNLKKLEEEIDLRNKLNDEMKKCGELSVEDDSDEFLKNEIVEKEKQLFELINKKNKLNDEKLRLTNKIVMNTGSYSKSRLYKTKNFSKICDIFQQLPNYYKEKYSKYHLIGNSTSRNDNELEMLRILEMSFDYLYMKYVEFKNLIEYNLSDYEKLIEKEKRIKLSADQKLEEEKRQKNFAKVIFEKQNKVLVMPKRKIADDRNKPLRKEKIEVKENKQDDDLDLQTLLTYEGDENFIYKK